MHRAANAVNISGFKMEEVGLLLRGAIEDSELKIGEVARQVQQATFGSEGVRDLGARPDVFPLPVSSIGPDAVRLIAVLKSGDTSINEMRASFAAAIKRSGRRAWISLVLIALNYLWVGNSAAAGLGRQMQPDVSVAQEQVLKRVERAVDRFLADGVSVPSTDWKRFLDLKVSKYDEGPVVKGIELSWDQMRAGLPAQGVAGNVRAVDLAGPSMRPFLLDPALSLKPISGRRG